jgi:hypothetical protein
MDSGSEREYQTISGQTPQTKTSTPSPQRVRRSKISDERLIAGHASGVRRDQVRKIDLLCAAHVDQIASFFLLVAGKALPSVDGLGNSDLAEKLHRGIEVFGNREARASACFASQSFLKLPVNCGRNSNERSCSDALLARR